MENTYSNTELISFCNFLLEHDIKIKNTTGFEEKMKLSSEESPNFIQKKLKINEDKFKKIIHFLISNKILAFDIKNDGGPDFRVNVELCQNLIKQLEAELK